MLDAFNRRAIHLAPSQARSNWIHRVEESGLIWHGVGGDTYWNEDEHLVLTLKAAETLTTSQPSHPSQPLGESVWGRKKLPYRLCFSHGYTPCVL